MIAVEKKPRTAPIFWERCPVHHDVVAFDGDRKLLGLCYGCVTEAARAQRLIEKGQV